MKCYHCNAIDSLEPTEALDSMVLDGRTYRAALPAEVCSQCGEAVFDSRDLEAFERAVVVEVVRLPPGPEAFRWIRRWLGLSGAGIAELLGVGRDTISRWENGGRRIDPLAWRLVSKMAGEQLVGRTETRDHLQTILEESPRTLVDFGSLQRKPDQVRDLEVLVGVTPAAAGVSPVTVEALAELLAQQGLSIDNLRIDVPLQQLLDRRPS